MVVRSTMISIGKCVSKIYYYFIIIIAVLTSIKQLSIDETEKRPDRSTNLAQSARFLCWSFFGYRSPDGYASETRSHQWHPSLSRDAMCCRDLILRLFQRYRASKELHFKIVQDMDSDKEEKNAVVKVAFMNSAVSEPINPMTALTNETAHSRVFSSCNERILDSLSTCKISCQAAEQ
ncbi:hypothetical protein QR680_002884 [Steinernema hermaphroditum]|uniref:Uncharacterized protein n=1 Tax=Steinernema hermaphroditum TaxID=289476 RepID=A0AA39LJ55_9BILA|nr:hypothetical protein QR680_002884 [Steinernema hermaphroditum]